MGFENGKLVRVVLAARKGAQEAVNVLHYDLIDAFGGTVNSPQALADTFRDDVVGPFRNCFTTDWTIDPVVVQMERDPQNPFAARTGWTAGTALPGNRATSSDPIPDAMCAVAKLLTEHIGRRHRGRIWCPPARDEADIAGNEFTPGGSYLALVGAYLAAIPNQPDINEADGASTANLCVFSRTARAADQDPYASHVTSKVLPGRIHWLRSRELGH